MDKNINTLGEAELEIMEVIWHSGEAVNAKHILSKIEGVRQWQLSTLMTSLKRLVDKGFLCCDKSLGVNLYSPLIGEQDYKAKESKSFLKRVYNNSIRSMVAALYDSDSLKSSDIEELRQYLDLLERSDKGEQ